MPFIGGRFYMNPAYGRAVERARNASAHPTNPRADEGPDAHWVTIDHRHVLIHEPNVKQSRHDKERRTDAGSAEYEAFMTAAKMLVDTSRIMLVTGVKIDVPRTLFGPSAEVTLTLSDAHTLEPVKQTPRQIQAIEYVAQGSGGPSSSVRDQKQFVDTITAGTTQGGVISQIFIVDGKRVATGITTQAGTLALSKINVLRTSQASVVYNGFTLAKR
jgi:hypothetical protein